MYYRAGFVDIYIVFLGFKGECVSNNYMHIIACGQHKNVIHNARIVFNRLPVLVPKYKHSTCYVRKA